VQLPPDLKSEVKAAAKAQGRTLVGYVIIALREKLERDAKGKPKG
jgi:hypothetical protein